LVKIKFKSQGDAQGTAPRLLRVTLLE